jgi:hypothetical protein
MKTKPVKIMDRTEIAMLLKIARRLSTAARRGRPVLPLEAKGFAEVLRRIARPQRKARSDAQSREFAAALSYTIRIELAGKRRSKIVRPNVAVLFNYRNEQQVANAVSRWRPAVRAWLARLENRTDYDKSRRREILKAELKCIEPIR